MRCPTHMNTRYKTIERLILKLAWVHSFNSQQLEEMVAVGNLAFVKAMRRFDGNEKTFSTYMYRVINNAMIDHLRKQRTFNQYCFLADMEEEPIECGYGQRLHFLDAMVDLSWETKCMIKDLLYDPFQLYKRAVCKSKTQLQTAFKKLMQDYGYRDCDINMAMEEITNFLKGV